MSLYDWVQGSETGDKGGGEGGGAEGKNPKGEGEGRQMSRWGGNAEEQEGEKEEGR